MLRAALIGFPSTGKTTLLRLLSRAGDPPGHAGGRQAAHVGVAQVTDPRLDRLTELFEPQRRVPATIEIAELAGHGGTRPLIDVTAFRNADALLHVLRMFRDDTVPHVAGAGGPGARRHADGGRADPGRPRRGRATSRTDSTGHEKRQESRAGRRGAGHRAVSDPPWRTAGRFGRSRRMPTTRGGSAGSASSRPNRYSSS